MNKKLLLFSIFILLSFGIVHLVLAQDDAGQPGEFLRYGVNARALGMGRAFTAVTDNANSVYWNPGGLYDIIRDGLSVTLMYSKLYESTSYNFAAIALPMELFISTDNQNGFANELKKWNFGFGYLALSSDDYEVRTRENQVTGEVFSDIQSAMIVSAARSFSIQEHRFGLGVSYKFLTHKLFNSETNIGAIDVGLKYQPNLSWLTFGVMVQNVNSPDFKFAAGASDVIPYSTRLGAAIHPKTGFKYLDSVLLSFDFMAISPGERSRDWFAGMEYDMLQSFTNIPIKLRLGVNSRERISFGINLDLPNNGLLSQANQVLPQLDWAYLPNQQSSLGGLTERFSLDFSYTPFTSERWYKRGIEKFNNKKYYQAKEDLNRALQAKNPKRLGYPVSASLRLGDIEVLTAKNKTEGLRSALFFYQQLSSEQTKNEIDAELNHKSYLYFLQSLFQQRRFKDVIHYASLDSIWGHHQTLKNQDNDVISLRSWSYFMLDQYDEAIPSLQQADHYALCDFLLGLIRLEQKRYQEARALFLRVLEAQETEIPEHLYVYPFQDRLLLDDAQFLYAFAGSKMEVAANGSVSMENLVEFAEIQRIYPVSDMNAFLQSGGHFAQLMNMIEDKKNMIIDSYYKSYVETLKMGSITISNLLANLR